MKADVDKLENNELVNVPAGLNNLKTKVDDKLNTKVNNFENKIPDATTLIHINQHNTDKQNLEKTIGDVDEKIPDVSGLVITTVLNAKIGEVENKIPDTGGLMTITVLDTKTGDVYNKVPDVSGLINKIVHNAKTSDIEKKYFTTLNYNKFTTEILDAKIKEKRLLDKFNISNLVKKSNLKRKLATLATKAELKAYFKTVANTNKVTA